MTVSKKKNHIAETFISYLNDRKMRLTSERMAVTEVVARHTGTFTVEDIYSEIARESRHVSRATVYNTMGLLCDASLVNAISLPDQSCVIYKVADNSSVQILRICDKCGNIRVAADRSIAPAIAGHAFRGFAPRAITINIFGLCPRCSRRSKMK